TFAEIDLDSLAFNLRSVKTFLKKDLLYMAVVKANAYGHGAVECSRRLEREGVDWFGVASPGEAFELRQNGITKPVLCFGGPWPGEEGLILQHSITPVVFDLSYAERIARANRDRCVKAKIHVEIETGMGRVGVPYENVAEFAGQLKNFPELEIEGMMTHFASADNLSEIAFTNSQIEKFKKSVGIFRSKGFSPSIIDMANSPGAVAYPASHGNMVRLGGILYGLGGDVLPPGIEHPELRPVMSVASAISFIKEVPKGSSLGYGRTFMTERESVIGTLPIGYQDGFRRGLSNRAQVLVNGAFAPVVGRISMDWTMIDLTDVPEPEIGDKVTLIGNENDLSIRAEDLAGQLDTISYEITCGISARVPRRYSQAVESKAERIE
ncbi:MAG TPA: alanine racemase, partial [Pyrinomonadaceae bacterium]|nr:alanine racemase [Pyrinomonadaceae bacterium]